ncbi:T9SS type A sorting domain-containing protein [Rubricoccus marinus]|uniref:Secretion system C-terminal sorting domain-containing protein n=1 Tax=Rubricoccus marinus TaxID=716817 RepID=A0A259TW58_9BACT|nr:T9SS type A sorting domain-containing protein [Rubricoccus marinus]OZC01788.1 hypothetical protein BSZ36_01565 [Rubricoccus marinus]
MTHPLLLSLRTSWTRPEPHPSRWVRLATALALAVLVLAAPRVQAQAQVSLPITFESGDATFYELFDFEGADSDITADPTDASNSVVTTVRPAGAGGVAGTTVANDNGFTQRVPFASGATTMSVRVWSPEAGVPVRFKLEKFNDPTITVEAQCPTTTAGGWETITYDFITDKVPGSADLNFNSEYSKATIFFDFGLENATEATTYYWDDVAFGGTAVEGGCRPPPPGPTVALPVTFEDGDRAFYELRDFGGNASQLIADPTDASNTVVESIRGANAPFFAGTTVADANGFTTPIPFASGATTMSVRVWSPEAGIPVRFKVENAGNSGISVEAQCPTTTAMAWETITYDFVADKVPNTADINFANEYTKASVFFNFGQENAPTPTTYYWDDVSFGGTAVPGGCNNATSGGDTIAEARAAGAGTEVTLTGVVTRAEGAFAYVQDATGAITVRQTSGAFFAEIAAGTIAAGTRVTLVGTTSEFRGLFQLNEGGLASYTVDGVTDVPAAQSITLAELASNGEAYEAELVELTGLTVAETGTFSAGTNYTATDDSGTGTLRIPNANDTALEGTDIPGAAFTFTGVVGQFTTATPATDGYQLLAIAEGDVLAPPMPVVSLPIRFESGDADYYELQDFGGNASTLVPDPEDASNTVVQSVRTATAACFAGTTVADRTGFTAPIPFASGATTMNVRVWSPEAGIPVLVKVEKAGTPEISVETVATTSVAGAWDVLVFDFANERTGTAALNLDSEYTKASIFFNFRCPDETPVAEATYYWDDLAFGSAPPVSAEETAAAQNVELAQNSPNPFTARTTIRFSLKAQGDVQLHVYNHLGQKVATLVDGSVASGDHAVSFDATGLASGMYFYRLQHSGSTVTRTMVLTR